MLTKKKVALAGALFLAVAVSGGAAWSTVSHESGSSDVTPVQQRQASRAALAAMGGGQVNSVERDGENGATWEVEVTDPSGHTVDVRLDKAFGVVVIESDDDSTSGR